MVAVRRTDRAGCGVLAVTEPRDEDQVREGRGMPNQVEVRGREDRNEITTLRQCRLYRTVIQGDGAIPGSRATGATTSTITRDCDRPIEERKGLPTVQVLSEAAKQVRRKEGVEPNDPIETRTPGPKDMIREVRRERGGAAHEGYGCSSLRVREWMLTMNSHGVEISIAGCVEEMVRDSNLIPSFFLYHVLCINQLLGTKTICSASYGKEKTPSPIFYPPRRQGKSHQPKSFWYETNRTPATQNKTSNSD